MHGTDYAHEPIQHSVGAIIHYALVHIDPVFIIGYIPR